MRGSRFSWRSLYRKAGLGVFVLVMIFGQFSATTNALSPAQKTLFQENINYFDASSSATCAPSAPTPAGNTPSSVFILGDSITVRTLAAYQQVFQQNGGTVTVDAASSRSLTSPGTEGTNGNNLSGMGAIAQDISAIKNASTIIIALGTNGISTSDIDAAIKALRADNSSAPIFWVDTFGISTGTYGSNGSMATNNGYIYSQASSDNYTIISWATAVDPRIDPKNPGKGGNDPNHYIDTVSDNLGVHPTQTGSQALAKLVSNAVSSSAGTPSAGSSCACGGDSTTLVGGDSATKVWNYLKGKGLSDPVVAGIMGNMQTESPGFDPQRVQGGGDSQTQPLVSQVGWGIVQWTYPYQVVTSLVQANNVSGPIYELSTQLNLVWAQMKGTSPNNQTNMLKDIVNLTDPQQVATVFDQEFEGGTDPGGTGPGPTGAGPGGIREKNAQDFFNQFGGSGSGSTSTTTGGCSTSSPDCTNASGNAAILCAAKKYDPVDYFWTGGHAGGAAYHQACPTIQANDSSCGLDCSGLVGVAIYDAFGNDQSWDTFTIVSDSSNWKSISFGELQAGDVIEPDPKHVEIVDHVSGTTVYTFGAHTDNAPQPDQVGPSSYPNANNPSYQYFRYHGQGS